MKKIEEKVFRRTEKLEDIIKRRQETEQKLTGLLTILSVGSLIMVWFKLKKSMSGKMILGGFGGGA